MNNLSPTSPSDNASLSRPFSSQHPKKSKKEKGSVETMIEGASSPPTHRSPPPPPIAPAQKQEEWIQSSKNKIKEMRETIEERKGEKVEKEKEKELARTPLPYLEELQKKTTERKFSQIKRDKEVTDLRAPEGTEFKFSRIGGSQNRVERVDQAKYFLLSELAEYQGSAVDISWEKIEQEVANFLKSTSMSERSQLRLKAWMKDNLEPIYTKTNGNSADKLQQMMKFLSRNLKNLGDTISTTPLTELSKLGQLHAYAQNLEKLRDSLEPLVAQCPLFSIENVPILYQKEELTASLRNYASFVLDTQPEASVQFYAAVKRITESPGTYLDQATVMKLLMEETAIDRLNETTGLSQEDSERILSRLNPYCSSLDILVRNQNSEVAAEKLREIAGSKPESKYADPSLSVKVGSENSRELLAQKMLAPLLLSDLFVFKEDRSKETEEPQTIAGEWLDKGVSFPRKEVDQILKLNHQLWQEMGKTSRNDQRISLLKEKLEEAERTLLDKLKINPEDLETRKNFESAMQEHALVDLLFCSYDSHEGQYKVQNGLPLCYDFARFLAPSPIYTKEEIDYTNLAENQILTHFTLRSFFLDHPVSYRPLSQETIKKIMSWDIDDIEAAYRKDHLLANPEIYELAGQQFELVEKQKDQLAKIQMKKIYEPTPEVAEEFHKLCESIYQNLGIDKDKLFSFLEKKIGDPTDPRAPILEEELIHYLDKELDRRRYEIKKNCRHFFNQVHPDAFKEFRDRMVGLQRYVSTEKEPTPQGIFRELYPDEALFMDILRRWDIHPAEHIAISKNPNDPFQTLEDIITKYETTKPKPTTNEISQLTQALERLKARAKPSYTLAFSMDLS